MYYYQQQYQQYCCCCCFQCAIILSSLNNYPLLNCYSHYFFCQSTLAVPNLSPHLLPYSSRCIDVTCFHCRKFPQKVLKKIAVKAGVRVNTHIQGQGPKRNPVTCFEHSKLYRQNVRWTRFQLRLSICSSGIISRDSDSLLCNFGERIANAANPLASDFDDELKPAIH